MIKKILFFFILIFGAARAYFSLTGGFVESNIYPTWGLEIDAAPAFSSIALPDLKTVLAQEYKWLGKGCQSYVFESEDGQYVIKFIKHQRMRPKPWHAFFASFPWKKLPYFGNSKWVEEIENKEEKKKQKLAFLRDSWKIAEKELQKESGVLYAHVKQTSGLFPSLTIYDKIGLKHKILLDEVEFLLQKKAVPLKEYLKNMEGDGKNTETFFRDLIDLVVSEYKRGYADNDQALMQNTGVLNGKPIHVDVGQFIKTEKIKEKAIYHQHLFDKMFKFRLWLEKNLPAMKEQIDRILDEYLEGKLASMTPDLRAGGVAALPAA